MLTHTRLWMHWDGWPLAVAVVRLLIHDVLPRLRGASATSYADLAL